MTKLSTYVTLGRTGLRVSPLALGTMTFDDGSWGSAPEESFAIVDRYLDEGGNFVDTANQYNGGASESTLGAYFAQRPGVRDRIVLATKFGGTLNPGDPNAGGAGRKAVLTQLDASLRRLNTEYVDVYWMHMWDRHTPLEETLSTLNDLVRTGKIRSFGLSNTPAWWVGQAATTARLRGWESVAALQVEYSLLARTVEGEQFGAARAFGLGITPWSPLASGVLSGKYSRTATDHPDSGRAGYAVPLLTEPTFVVLDTLERIAKDLGTTVARVSLAWVRQQQPVTSVLVGARTLAQLEDNLASADVVLEAAHLAELDALTTPALDYPHPFVDEVGIGFQQGDTTVNGLTSAAFRRT
ncbi:aldo/keto reductase [Streptomyces prunicolor]|jgi:aryl-alcohol dehydrogenase-like predicted oxidoreductase|uniref:Aldo/keto reductase n=1 Tax=Streptomyces prunicolor TaxID=67348 RepID=A0ABU4FQK0_9ACTN|nr:aldo/keto reductase [Streptomyces prunicolor]MCX5235892.1 aldo/keto reductase [Streptomyces prunicolor]MDV7222852.1 aldo/keto reductase [Streptomyces prunicolor]